MCHGRQGSPRQLLLGRGLLRNEVAKTNGVHVVSLFVDLESFFDTIQFQQLITAATALQYPPLILKMALEVYMGARYLVADGVLSAGIRATNGVQAGCPAAPSLAKVALHPVIDKIQRRRDVANVDCWLDDVSIDIQHKSFKQVADSAIRVYRSLKDGMDANGFTISSKKTGFVASSTQASKHLRELLLPHEPQVYDVMRDLGVDSTGGRKRRLVTSATRAKKAHARHSKLSRLGPPPSTKLRVVKAAITSVALWGHPSVGVSPKRMKWLRTVVWVNTSLGVWKPSWTWEPRNARIQSAQSTSSISRWWPRFSVHGLVAEKPTLTWPGKPLGRG